jgi:hypothetical protein
MEALYLLLLAGATSTAVYLLGRRRLGLGPAGLRPALERVLECVGLTVALAALNLGAGFLLVLAMRGVTGTFVSLYLNTDSTLMALSALQAIALQWWMRSGED